MTTLKTIAGSITVMLGLSPAAQAFELFTAPLPALSPLDTIVCSAVNISSAAQTISISFIDGTNDAPVPTHSCKVTPGPLSSQACSFSLRAREIGHSIPPFRCEFFGTGAMAASICVQHTQHVDAPDTACLPAFPPPE